MGAGEAEAEGEAAPGVATPALEAAVAAPEAAAAPEAPAAPEAAAAPDAPAAPEAAAAPEAPAAPETAASPEAPAAPEAAAAPGSALELAERQRVPVPEAERVGVLLPLLLTVELLLAAGK